MARKTTRHQATVPPGWLDIDSVVKQLQKSINDAGGQRAWGRMHGISPSYINKVLCGHKIPGDKITRALGLEGALLWRVPAH